MTFPPFGTHRCTLRLFRDVQAKPQFQPNLSDEELIRLTSAGDKAAFRLFVERHQASVFRHVRSLTSTNEDAEDALQEAFLSAYRHASGFRAEASARTWLFTIARNASFRLGRTPVAEPLPEDHRELELLGEAAGWGSSDNPEDLAIKAQDRGRLIKAMERLRTEDREVLILRDIEGLTGEETAQVLGLGLRAMKTRLHRARLRLAEAFRKGERS